MNVNNYCLDFFLGVTSPYGFCSYFNEMTDYKQNWRNYIIKGGPGTGKSSLMKKIANKLYEYPSNVELIHCSSDPYSLDAVISYDDNFAIFDGTAPHVVEPLYPGVFETNVNLSEFWDESKLSAHSETIIKLFKKNKEFHERNLRFLKASNQIMNDNFQLVLKNTNTSKIYKLSKRIVLKEFSKKKKRTGIEKKRFLSAITPNGYITFTDTAKKLAKKIYIIKDEIGVSSSLLLSFIRKYLLEYGYSFYTCYSPFDPYNKIEHIFIPELNLGFMTQHKFNELNIEHFRIINFSRFVNIEALKLDKQKINLNRKLISELVNESISSLKAAKSIHDDMEEFYINAMDFDLVHKKADQIIENIKNNNK